MHGLTRWAPTLVLLTEAACTPRSVASTTNTAASTTRICGRAAYGYLIEDEPVLTVIVIDGATSQRICDATVEGQLGGATYPFEANRPSEWGPPWTCRYSAPQRAGNIRIDVMHAGYWPNSVETHVNIDECGNARSSSIGIGLLPLQ
jgi:hypothetical protein